ncbi:putative inner membrane protein [mine drainage metagenome]|uniref:Putative inner membrane protein n=1 Tax=mine drainage metagenome TaxID=410659 RepID=A0A1J5QXU0_9ZZZZ
MINASQLARIALVVLLAAGCVFVLRPFMAAILFAAVVCVFSWPFYRRLWSRLGGRDTLAALTMTLLLLLAMIVPMAYLAAHLADSVAVLFEQIRPALEHPQPSAPEWMRHLPLVGGAINDFWQRIAASNDELMKSLSQFYEPIRNFGLKAVKMVGEGVLQLLLVVFVAFFLYRDGVRLAAALTVMARKLGGDLGREMLELSASTVNAVMLGIFGTAIAQSAVALLGFLLAGAPAPALLAAATFFLSMIPVGPPLIWGGAALWLFNNGQHGWAIFLAVYGLLAISSVDNLVKPALISHSANLPMLVIALGVLGGAIAFGFVGIFLGPTLLAIGLTLTQRWIAFHDEKTEGAS